MVAGDDRQARDLAADLRAWLEPRPVRFYPSRGVAYESHLAPPPHLVGLRVAALDALLAERADGEEPPVVVVSAVALSEKVPDPALRPHSFTIRVGDLLDLDEVGQQLVAAGYERVDQVDDRGQFAIRGGILDLYPATEDRAVRIDLFDIEVESIRCFSTFTQRSLGETDGDRDRPGRRARARAPRAGRDRRARGRRGSPRRRRAAARRPLPRLPRPARPTRPSSSPPRRTSRPALADHWQDVCAAFHDDDAHHLYVKPDAIAAALDARASVRLSSISADQPIEFRAQAADLAARSLKEAEPELEKLVRSDYRTVVTWTRRGDGERAAYNLARLRASLGRRRRPAVRRARRCATASSPPACSWRSSPTTGSSAAAAPSGAERPTRRRGALRSFADLRTGDIVVHEDHGIARFAGFDTKTVAGVTRDYLELEYAGTDRVFMPVDQLAKITRYVGAGGSHPPLSKLGGKAWEAMKARARRAAQELAGELLNLYAERRRRPGTPSPRTASGCASSRRASPTRRPPTSARRSSTSRPTWSARSRWTA